MSTFSKTVQIHIDGKHFPVSPEVTGADLYQIGHVGDDYDLYLEVKGPGDDEVVPNTSTEVHPTQGAHFYTAKRTLNPGA